jgi:hypothetical protein
MEMGSQHHALTDLPPGMVVKGKAIPLQALTGPEGSGSLRLPDLKTIGV